MLNHSSLVGRLTKDPELKHTKGNGVAYVKFTLAVARNFTNSQGEKETDFIVCIAWRKQAESLAKYMQKGSRIAVEGRIQSSNYEGSDGKTVFTTEIKVEDIHFLSPMRKEESAEYNSSHQGQGQQYSGQHEQQPNYQQQQNQQPYQQQQGYDGSQQEYQGQNVYTQPNNGGQHNQHNHYHQPNQGSHQHQQQTSGVGIGGGGFPPLEDDNLPFY